MADELVKQQESMIAGIDENQVRATMQKIKHFQSIIRESLTQDHDYGAIPGTGNKPTLLKPGAEKILMLMGLTSEYEVTEKVQDYEKGFFAFTVKCVLSTNDIKVTEGFGHANTRESRYLYRWVTEKDVPEGMNKEDLKSRELDGKYGRYTKYLIENDDPYTLVNTVLKMAKKRAQVDGALTVASLSDIFTQDLEDMSETVSGGEAEQPASSKQKNYCHTLLGNQDMRKVIKDIIGEDLTVDDLTSNQASTLIGELKTREPVTEDQRKKIKDAADEAGYSTEDMKKLLQDKYKIDSSTKLTKPQARELIDHLKNSGGITDQEAEAADAEIEWPEPGAEMDYQAGKIEGGPDF